ncbi:putative colanic acid biosynthesis acetyltransferase WcaF [Methylocella tundrae]|uniref:Putative colanic acid biosynthesis acetyltransferase WcaF n=1 Tax=Methylocella tundrae TaxID=227605 RepID=A0A8B6M236_METTU|nr:putative colanic acid biosynthesis acetyltransferase [Methylocella tundrae]VTZ49081.1 putative colanic acid biosynthesis acetyltransferase WcaF [Methylocella tundrae]
MLEPLEASKANALHGGPSFSLKNRIIRAVWNLTWLLLASWTPPPLHGWRRFLLRAFGAKIGRGARIYGSVKVWLPSNLEMGDHSTIGWNVNCYCQGKVTLEDYASVSQYSHLVSGTHDIDSPTFQLYTRPIRICRYAWVASDAFVGPGVTVGEGAVLGARGVAFKSLEPWTVYGGNPARVIRKRRSAIAQQPNEIQSAD